MKPFSVRFPWITVTLVALCAVASFAPADALEFDRTRVAAGEIWRLVTGQLVHWTPRMAAFDVGMLLGLGIWLEVRGDRRLMVTSLALGGGLEFASVVALIVIFGLGVDALVHFLNRLRIEERVGDAPEQAIRRARVLVGPAIILTTIVLAFGLGVTVFSDLPSLRTFGLVCGVTLLASLVADLVFLPATVLLYRRFVSRHH